MNEPKKKTSNVSCVDCKAWACFPDVSKAKTSRREPPPYCPARVQKEVCEEALAKYNGKSLEFAHNVALIENSCYALGGFANDHDASKSRRNNHACQSIRL
jgi:hypothetical protein